LKKNKIQPASQPRRILVMRYSSLGDVVLTNPVLDRLKSAYPQASIYFATKDKFAPLVAFHPAVTQVISLAGGGFFIFLRHLWSLKSLKPTMVLDLHDSLRTRLLRLFLGKADVSVYEKEAIQRRLLVKKLQVKPSLPTVLKYLNALEKWGISSSSRVQCLVHLSREAQAFAAGFLRKNKIEKAEWVVGLGPGATWNTKQWPPEYYAELATHWIQKKARVIWFGDSAEVDLIHSIQRLITIRSSEGGLCAAGKFSLEQTAAFLGRCNIFIGNDSGLIHLASGRGVPVTVIYGSTTPSLGFEPWGKHQVAEVKGLDCRPCDVHGKSACPLGHFKCMKSLLVDKVEARVKVLTRKG
jgi:heptosyltransferase II